MRINIIGASGAGVTTLGLALADKTGYAYVDSDFYYWDNTTTADPYTVKRPIIQRNNLIMDKLHSHDNWILGGPVMGWGFTAAIDFDLVVFLHVPPAIRMRRLKKREFERYGDIIYTDAERNRQFVEFMNWAAGYDDNTAPTSRTLQKHLNWLQTLQCPVLRISGDTTVNERVARVWEMMEQISS